MDDWDGIATHYTVVCQDCGTGEESTEDCEDAKHFGFELVAMGWHCLEGVWVCGACAYGRQTTLPVFGWQHKKADGTKADYDRLNNND